MLPAAGILIKLVFGLLLGVGAIKAMLTGGWRRGVAVVMVLLVGAGAAWPFFSNRATGTGEAFNYHLAVADAVAQMRAGEFPVLVGQTEYAYNGRVHPLRTAPYFAVLAGAINALGDGRRSAWLLQNLSLAFSLILAVATTYATLRWMTRCTHRWALALATVYGSGPALLAAAYGMDLYMTVYVAPFVPLALGAAARPAITRSGWSDVVLGGALGLAWWAHPPVALWTTTAAVLLRFFAGSLRFSWRSAGWLLAGGLVGAALAGFAFASVFALGHPVATTSEAGRANSVAAIMEVIRGAFPACLLPISPSGDRLGDFQLGYGGWALFVAGIILLFRGATWGARRHRRKIVGAFLAIAALLLILTLPVPIITAAIWRCLPGIFFQLTNIWPMQRVYLPALAAIVLAAGTALPAMRAAPRLQRSIPSLLLLGLLGAATLFQARPFLRRGFAIRQTADQTVQRDRPTNRDITVTSYAMLGVPTSYTQGVVEPWAEFRVLRHGDEVVSDNYSAALSTSHIVGHGRFPAPAGIGKNSTAPGPPALRLEPGKRYLLTLQWQNKPAAGLLVIAGHETYREYTLPGQSQPLGFGPEPGQRAGFAISSALSSPEEIAVRYINDAAGSPPAQADYTLREVSEDSLPVVLQHWLPLSLQVDAAGPGCYVETPQRFVPGYTALVNGQPARTLSSPQGNVMVALPAGRSAVTIAYRAPTPVKIAFRISACAALGCGLLELAALICPVALRRSRVQLDRIVPIGATVAAAILVAGCGLIFLPTTANRLSTAETVGPVRLEFELQHGATGRRQPLLAGGIPQRGNIVYLEYLDAAHVRVSIEAWGVVRRSEPVLVDYYAPHELVISADMLHPLSAPVMQALPSWQQQSLRDEVRIELDGQTLIMERLATFDADPATLTVGRSRLGNSTSEAEFLGKITRVERLPLTNTSIWLDSSLRLEGVFPQSPSQPSQPLLATSQPAGASALFAVTYLGAETVRLSYMTVNNPRFDSPPLPLRKTREFVFEIRKDAGDHFGCFLDGQRCFALPDGSLSSTKPSLATVGLNPASFPGVAARFTGPSLRRIQAVPINRGSSGDGLAGHPVRMIVALPRDRTGVAEPLLSTGETGSGDLLYMVYSGPDHVRFGYDHWSVGGGVSEPIACRYGDLHMIEISTGALLGKTSPAPPVEISLDGQPVWHLSGLAYPTLPESIAIGENRIHGSSCVDKFTGRIFDAAPVTADGKIGIANPAPDAPTIPR